MTLSKDMEIIRCAAAAAGLRISNWRSIGGAYVTSATRRSPFAWDPENDSAHALDLAALLRMPIWHQDDAVITDQRKCGEKGWRVEIALDDLNRAKAVRRAILMAAAVRGGYRP